MQTRINPCTQVPPCPTNNPKYKLVDGKCYYLEKTSLNYQGAINNCKEKFKNDGGNGILFEPTSVDEFNKVYQAAKTFLDLDNTSAWIGIKKSSNGILVYSRTGQPITWYSVHNISLSRNDRFCIVVYRGYLLDSCYTIDEKKSSICVNNI